jgi:hypothetical protein
MRRLYTYSGRGISTKLKSTLDGKTYIISTAPNPHGGWELAVFRNIFGVSNVFRPLRVARTDTFAEAEEEHIKTEVMVAQLSRDDWQNWPIDFG